jgi:hypothetical protein
MFILPKSSSFQLSIWLREARGIWGGLMEWMAKVGTISSGWFWRLFSLLSRRFLARTSYYSVSCYFYWN